MGQRFTLDRMSFEQFLAAASFLQQVQKQAACNGVRDFRFAQPLLELVETQHAIESGRLSLETAINRIVGLGMKVVGATGAAAWLFTQNEFVFCAGAGSTAREDDRLRLQVLAKLAGSCQLHSDAPLAFSNLSVPYDDDGYYPGSVKSLLVAPIYQGRDIAGALAACSPELDAFEDRDATNLRLLAGLIAHALSKTAAAGLKQTMALERVAMLKVIHRIMPTLQQLVDERVQAQNAEHNNYVPAEDVVGAGIPETSEGGSADGEFAQTAAGENIGPIEVVNACQKTFDELPLEPVVSSSQVADSVDDISLPFVGVRAALGGEVVEEPHFGARIVGALTWPGRRVGAGLASFFRGLAWELDGLRQAGARAGVRVRRTLTYRPTLPHLTVPHPKLPKMPQLHFREHLVGVRSSFVRVRSSLKAASRGISAGLGRTSSSFGKLATRPLANMSGAKFRHRVLATRIAVITGLKLTRIRVRAALRQVPSIPTLSITFPQLPTGVLKQELSRVRSGLLRVAAQGRAELAFVVRHRPRSRNLHRAAPAGAILLVMIAFLISEAGLYHPGQTAVASGKTVSTASILAVPSQTSLKVGPGPNTEKSPTHRQITDAAVMDEVQELSRYEIAGIRRLAGSGDDYSEFELGMLYETGHGVTQSCEKAAQWVAKAAEHGNPAAEYNLGLRYRDGDGVAVNQTEADRWLQKAAAHKYSHPKLALTAATTALGN